MKASELRIGNLIYWNIPQKDGIPHEVIGIMEDRVYTTPISLGNSMDDYLPIPLTEEWLLKFGFEFAEDLMGHTHDKYPFTIYGNEFIISTRGGYKDEFKSKVEYVHQLQNLYFALTGEELQIK